MDGLKITLNRSTDAESKPVDAAEAAARLDAGVPTLRPGDWNSGTTLRIIDLITPFGGREEMEKEFAEMVR